jgi:hypothetical protein
VGPLIRRARALVAAAAVAAAAGVRADGPVHALDEDLGGPPSRYAGALLSAAQRRELPVAPDAGPAPVALRCVATPGDGKYVGIVQWMDVGAPVDAVDAVIADVGHYRDLYPGVADAREVPGSRDGNRWVTAWEQRVPVFFIPNTRYQLTTLVSRSAARVVYRYRLARRGELTSSDGLIVLEAAGAGRTRFVEYDFFNARWGLVPERLVWRESLRGAFGSDVALKLRAEHPAWSFKRIGAEVERLGREAEGLIERCAAHRVAPADVFPEPLATACEGSRSDPTAAGACW